MQTIKNYTQITTRNLKIGQRGNLDLWPILSFFTWFHLVAFMGHMISWKGPNDPKTLPRGMIYNYKSCWPTLGPSMSIEMG